MRREQSTLETWLFVAVSVLGVGFLIIATIALVRAMQSTPTPVGERVTEQAAAVAQTSDAAAEGGVVVPTDSAGAVLVVTATAPPAQAPTNEDGLATDDLPAPGPTVTATLMRPTDAPGLATNTAAPTLAPSTTPLPTNTLAGPAATPTIDNAPTATVQPSPVPPTATQRVVSSGGLGSGPLPGPSPTWVLEYIPTPAPASGPSKLGFHVTLTSGGVIEFSAAVQPAVMKGVEDIGVLREVKAVSPNTVTIGRYIVDEWQATIGEGDPTTEAIRFVESQLSRYEPHRAYVDYWEGYNEVHWSHMEWYAQFEAARACEMQRLGYKAAIGSFSTGVPEPWQFEMFLPAIEAGIRCDAILTLHEYGAPTLYLWWTQGIPSVEGQPHYPDRGPLAGRYRWLYRDILIPRGLVIPLAITEAGIDGLVAMAERPESDYTGPGWLNFRDFWVSQGLTDDPTAFYVQQLIWYDSLLRQDDYVIGATIYTIAGGCCPQQATYEAAPIVPLLTEYMLTLR